MYPPVQLLYANKVIFKNDNWLASYSVWYMEKSEYMSVPFAFI
jgi:hypothetical protein